MREQVGTIRQRENGKWQYLFTVRDEDGKRRQITKGGHSTEAAARRALAVAISDHERGLRTPRQQQIPTLAAFVRDEWLPSLDLAPSTLSSYRWLSEQYLLPHLGSRRLTQVSGRNLAKLYSDLAGSGGKKGQGLSPSTVRKVHAVVSGVFHHAMEMGLTPQTPVTAVPRRHRPSAVRVRPNRDLWTEAQCREFLRLSRGLTMGDVWHLMLATGLRRGEAAALRWSDIVPDGDDPYIVVTRNRTMSGGVVSEGPPKSGHGRRISIQTDVVERLKPRRIAQAKDKLAAGAAYHDGDFVIADPLGQPMRPDGLTYRFCRDRCALDLPPIRLHDLRHLHATFLLSNCVPAKAVQERLGHSSIQVTLDMYAHVTAELEQQAAAVIGSVLQLDPERTA